MIENKEFLGRKSQYPTNKLRYLKKNELNKIEFN